MGDARFESAWAEWTRQQAAGASRAALLEEADERFLVETLASKGAGDAPVDRNVLATELLNRVARRARRKFDEREIAEITREVRATIARSEEVVARSRRSADEAHQLVREHDPRERKDVRDDASRSDTA